MISSRTPKVKIVKNLSGIFLHQCIFAMHKGYTAQVNGKANTKREMVAPPGQFIALQVVYCAQRDIFCDTVTGNN